MNQSMELTISLLYKNTMDRVGSLSSSLPPNENQSIQPKRDNGLISCHLVKLWILKPLYLRHTVLENVAMLVNINS